MGGGDVLDPHSTSATPPFQPMAEFARPLLPPSSANVSTFPTPYLLPCQHISQKEEDGYYAEECHFFLLSTSEPNYTNLKTDPIKSKKKCSALFCL